MGTKKLGLIALFVVIVGAAFFVLRPKTNAPTVLRFCTWSNYYPDAVLQDFTQKTGIQLELSYISSNEELLAKFKAGANDFDLIQPSDYMVRQMGKMGMLADLDHAKLTNLNHLDEFYTKLSYDPGNKLSVPFTWGTTGIAINTEKVKIPVDGVSWKMLLASPDPHHTSLLDDMREVFTTVLLSKNLSMNTTDLTTLEGAKTEIAGVKNKILMFTSEPRALLAKGEIYIAHIYSVDGVQAGVDNPKIQYYIPKEGATLWTDNFAIPKTSKKMAEAHEFINYFLDPKNAARIATENNLATPNKTARALLPEEQKNNPGLYPSPETMGRLYFMEDLGDVLNTVNRMWTELKSG